MENLELVRQRLRNQLVSDSPFSQPDHVVKWMGAIQAQHLAAAIIAIGLRVASHSKSTAVDVERAIVDRKIVRTWPMRGTLHFVPAEDLRWMLDLLTPRVIRNSAGRYRQLELDEKVFSKIRIVVEKALEKGGQLSRAEIYQVLEENGIATTDQRGIHILGYLAQNGVICFGPHRGKQPSFVLLDEWIPDKKILENDAGLAILAGRYFKSHGPATVYDFAYWSGLVLAQTKRGIELVKEELDYRVIKDMTYFYPEQEVKERPYPDGHPLFLLPAFDEVLCGYKDKTATFGSLDIKSIILKNGIIQPMIMTKNQTVGTWKQSIKNEHMRIEAYLFQKITALEKEKIEEKAMELGYFLNKEVAVHFL